MTAFRGDPRSEEPILKISCGFAAAGGDEKRSQQLVCEQIAGFVHHASQSDVPSWKIRVLSPSTGVPNAHSPSDAVQRHIESLTGLDALIAVHFGDGTAISGMELGLALIRGIPILLAYPETQGLDPGFYGIAEAVLSMVIRPFSSLEHLEQLVSEWISSQAAMLQTSPTLRTSGQQIWEPLRSEFQSKWKDIWESCTPDTIAMICFLSGMGAEEIERVLSACSLISCLPAAKLFRLGTALKVSVSQFVEGYMQPVPLTDLEQQALIEWQRAQRYSDELRGVLQRAAQQWKCQDIVSDEDRILSGAPARKQGYDFTDTAHWGLFYRDWRDGNLD